MSRKLFDIEEEKIEMTQFDKDSQIVKTTKLALPRWFSVWTNLIIPITSKTGHLATLYLRITWLPMAILCISNTGISNPTLLSIRNLRMESLSL